MIRLQQRFLGRTFTCGQRLLWRDRDDGVGLHDLKNAVSPANERMPLQFQRVRTAESQKQRSSGVLLSPLGQGELSGPSTQYVVRCCQRTEGRNGSFSFPLLGVGPAVLLRRGACFSCSLSTSLATPNSVFLLYRRTSRRPRAGNGVASRLLARGENCF